MNWDALKPCSYNGLWNLESRMSNLKFLEEGGGGGTLLVAVLSPLTIDHACLSTRSTVSTPLIETPPIFGRSLRFFHIH